MSHHEEEIKQALLAKDMRALTAAMLSASQRLGDRLTKRMALNALSELPKDIQEWWDTPHPDNPDEQLLDALMAIEDTHEAEKRAAFQRVLNSPDVKSIRVPRITGQ